MKQILHNAVVMVFARNQRFGIHPLLLPNDHIMKDFT